VTALGARPLAAEGAGVSQPAAPVARRWRLVSPMLSRILLVNALPLILLVMTLLYLDQYQNGLLEAEVSALREQARVYAGALGQSAVVTAEGESPKLDPAIARPLLWRLTDPVPTAQAKLYAPDGRIVADSSIRDSGAGPRAEPMPPAVDRGPVIGTIGWIYDKVLSWLPHEAAPKLVVDSTPGAAGPDWQPDVKEELRLSSTDEGREMPPYIRRTNDDRLLITVAAPVEQDDQTVGVILLTRDVREVDDSLFTIRISILALFGVALVLTVLLSWYLSLTIARPILRLAAAAAQMREGKGRIGGVPNGLRARRDEIGTLATALNESANALWTRMDAIEQFAADVAHEIKNPLSSIRSATETLRRASDDPATDAQRRRLLGIIGDDVQRLDRLITDISDASRVDAELSRTAAEPIDVAPILAILAEIADATRREDDARVQLDAPAEGLVVMAVEDRLVQVLRNLIANAQSFSRAHGVIGLRARETGGWVEISVEDDGPGIPDAKLEHIFDRFYSERPPGERFGQHSGLGLSISRQIVEALRGRISAENRRAEDGSVLGARFVVRLPRA
jgi:two-component system sensor histidine kinase ChvG